MEKKSVHLLKLQEYPDYAELKGRLNKLEDQREKARGRITSLLTRQIYGERGPAYDGERGTVQDEVRELDRSIEMLGAQLQALKLCYSQQILKGRRPEYEAIVARLLRAALDLQAAQRADQEWRTTRELEDLDLASLPAPPFLTDLGSMDIKSSPIGFFIDFLRENYPELLKTVKEGSYAKI